MPDAFAGNPAIATQVAPPQGANALTSYAQMVAIQNAQNQNRLFQQSFGSNQAIGQLFSQSVDPQTGQFDINKFSALAAQNPQAAFRLPEVWQQLEQRRLTQLQAQGAQIKNSSDRLGIFNSAITSLLDKGDNIQHGDLLDAIGSIAGSGPGFAFDLNDPDQAKTIGQQLSTLPSGGPALHQALRERLLQSMDAKQRADTMYGNIQNLIRGNVVQPTQQSPFMGTSAPVGAPQPMGLTPAEAVTPHEIKLPSGATGTYTGAQIASGQTPLGPAGGASTQPPAPGRTPTPAAAPGPGVGTTTPTPGQLEEQTTGGKDFAGYEKSLSDTLASEYDFNRRIQEMRTLLPQIQTGGGAEIRAKAAQAAQAVGNILGYSQAEMQPAIDAINNGDLGKTQEFKKFALQGAMQQLTSQLKGALGSRVNMTEFEQYVKNNPNLLTDPRGIEYMFNYFTKIYDQDKAEQGFMNNYKQQPGVTPNLSDYSQAWQAEAAKQGYANLARPTGQYKGAPGVATHRFNPATGKIETIQ